MVKHNEQRLLVGAVEVQRFKFLIYFIDLSARDYAVGDIITSSAKHITTGERIPLWTRNKTITDGGATFVLSVNAGNGGNTIRVYAICVKAGTVDTAVSYTVDVDGLKPIS